ncbi:MAG: hypothetical protein WAV02_15155, partial [Stellaceae bacterium]
MILVAAVIVLAVLIALGGLTLRERARLSEAETRRNAAEAREERLAAIVGTEPLAGFLWRADGSEAALGALPGQTAAATFAD